jgi:uncharacterized protein
MNFAKQSNSKVLSRPVLTRRTFFRLCGGVTAVGLADGLVEPFSLEATAHEVSLPNLPAALDGLKVVQLTDPHRGDLTPDAVIRAAVRQAAAWEPDLVVLTGDYVRWDAADALPLARLLSPLRPRLGMLAILGNHDYENPERLVRTLTETAGIRLLRNASVELAPGLFVSGIEDTWRGVPDPGTALQGVPGDAALLFLTHNPVGVRFVQNRACLALAGHTHGGQICVPGLSPHFPPGMEGFDRIAGWGTYGGARLYISRGIGCTAYPVRLNCPPEVSLFTLRPVGHS